MPKAHVAVVQELLRSNAAANAGTIMRAKGDVDVAELTWGQPHLPAGWEQPDVVLAADLVHGSDESLAEVTGCFQCQ